MHKPPVHIHAEGDSTTREAAGRQKKEVSEVLVSIGRQFISLRVSFDEMKLEVWETRLKRTTISLYERVVVEEHITSSIDASAQHTCETQRVADQRKEAFLTNKGTGSSKCVSQHESLSPQQVVSTGSVQRFCPRGHILSIVNA
jgi:hypothetical protein